MTVHLIKLCVGADSVEDLAAWQQQRWADSVRTGTPRLFHTTRMVPKRQDELLDGGSLYWVIRGIVQVRQRIVGFDSGAKQDGTPCCLILLDPALIGVRPVPRRPFQGWRYLPDSDVPPDVVGDAGDDIARMPTAMRRDLAELGLL